MKVAIYCRLSDEDRNKQTELDDSESIQNQKTMLIEYALENNWDIFEIYSDDDYTGADRNRPQFKKLLKDAEAKKFDIVLCKTQSRFTRELELVEKYIHHLFPLWGIRFVGKVDNADTAIKGNKKSRQINGLVNEWYLEDLSDSIKSVFDTKRQNGVHIGAFALYGYKKDPDKKGHLIIDEEAAQIVREVFDLFAKGYGKTNIARLLNDRGIPNPTEYKRLNGLRYSPPKTKQGTLWKYFSISNMLTNEIYIGNMVQGKYGSVSYKTKENKPRPKETWYKVESTHEPIIDIELWNTVQEMVRQKAKPFLVGNVGIFAKKAKCAHCGYVMRSSKQRDGRHYLQCQTRHIAKDACIGSFISVRKLEASVISELQKLLDSYLNVDECYAKLSLNANHQQKRAEIEKAIQAYKKSYSEYNTAIKSLYLDKANSRISEDEFIEFSKDFGIEKDRLAKLIKDCEEQLAIIEGKSKQADNKKAIIEKYRTVDTLTREMVVELIDFISISKKDPVTKEQKIKIHWNL